MLIFGYTLTYTRILFLFSSVLSGIIIVALIVKYQLQPAMKDAKRKYLHFKALSRMVVSFVYSIVVCGLTLFVSSISSNIYPYILILGLILSIYLCSFIAVYVRYGSEIAVKGWK